MRSNSSMLQPTGNSYSTRQLQSLMQALAPIKPLLLDENVNEIMVNGPNDVFIRSSGPDRRVDVALPEQSIRAAITLLANYVAKEANSNQLLLSARLPGFRVEAALPPVAIKGPQMCIRRHASRIVTMDEYVAQGVATQEQADMISGIIDSRKNFLIAGGTFSGKTTLMNCILSMIDPRHRLFIVEQVCELRIAAENHVIFECDPEFGVTATAAVRAAMRNSPNRIILGELRGPEANDWLEASNTGHPGSGATLHANSSSDALKRLSSLIMMASTAMPFDVIQDRIASTVDAVIFIEQAYGKRLISEICLVKGYDRAAGQILTEVHYHPARKENL